mgnify:CR=1 FL=1
MKAFDIMTEKVQTVTPDMSVLEAAALMAEKHISGLPVVSEHGEVIGIVSESDLIHRAEIGTDRQPTRWLGYFPKPEEMAEQFTKAHGHKVHDVMARPVVSVEADADITEVADTLDHYGYKRLPVMKAGTLVGIIARSDLVRALSHAEVSAAKAPRPTTPLRETIERSMKTLPWLDTSYLNMTVFDGVVRLRGYVQSEQHLEALKVLLEDVPDVVAVETQHVSVGLPSLNWDGVYS